MRKQKITSKIPSSEAHKTADPPSDRLIRRPPDDSEIHFKPESPPNPPTSIEESEAKKVVLKVRVPFEKKKFDLSICILMRQQ